MSLFITCPPNVIFHTTIRRFLIKISKNKIFLSNHQSLIRVLTEISIIEIKFMKINLFADVCFTSWSSSSIIKFETSLMSTIWHTYTSSYSHPYTNLCITLLLISITNWLQIIIQCFECLESFYIVKLPRWRFYELLIAKWWSGIRRDNM